MTRCLLLLFLGSAGMAFAEDFVPPQAYPLDRYESGWQKNPFTLKTAPPTMQQESFAKDLVLGSVSQIGNSTSVTVVNVKTRDRIHLRDTEPSSAGIKVDSVHLAEKRKDIFVKLAMGNATAVVRYDDAALKTWAAAGDPKAAAKMNGAAQMNGAGAPPIPNPGAAGQPPPPIMPPNMIQGNQTMQNTTAMPVGAVPTSLRPQDPNTLPPNIPTPARRRQLTLPTPPIPR
jgi:hypothetical protein